MDIIPLPYIKIFTNKKGVIETLCNLNGAPKLQCELLAGFLTSHSYVENQKSTHVLSNEIESITEDADYERALELYSNPINAEFRLNYHFNKGFSYQWTKEVHSKIIKMAIKNKAVKALDDAINRRFNKNS